MTVIEVRDRRSVAEAIDNLIAVREDPDSLRRDRIAAWKGVDDAVERAIGRYLRSIETPEL